MAVVNLTNNAPIMDELPYNQGTASMTLQAYQSLLLGLIDQEANAAANEMAVGPILSDQWLVDGRLFVETTNFRIWLTPKTFHSIGTFGSSITEIEIFNKSNGDLISYQGSVNYVGLPMVSTMLVGSTITSLTVAATSIVPGIDQFAVRFEGNVVAGNLGFTGTITKFEELVKLSGSGGYVESELIGNQVFSGATNSVSPAVLTSITSVVYDASFTLMSSTTLQGLSLHTNTATPLSSYEDALAGSDTVVAAGTFGAYFDGFGGNDNMVGSAAGDTLFGGLGNDSIRGNAGNDLIDGGAGIDTAYFSGTRAQYTVQKASTSIFVTDTTVSRDGADQYAGVETLRFMDITLDLTMAEKAQGISAAALNTLAELYVGFFNRIPEAAGLSYWIGQVQSGMSLRDVADQFYSAGVQFGVYSVSMTEAQFITAIYGNVLGRTGASAPNNQEIGYWQDWLHTGTNSKGAMVLQMLSDSHTFFTGDPAVGWVVNLLNNKAQVASYFAIRLGASYNDAQTNISQGMAIAAAITPTDTAGAIGLIGIDPVL